MLAIESTNPAANTGTRQDIGFYFACAILLNLIWFVILTYGWDHIELLADNVSWHSIFFVAPYAFLAAIGLNWARLLRRWQSALFFAMVLFAHYWAHLLTAVAGSALSGNYAWEGCVGGFTGSFVSYLGLVLITWRWSASTLKNVFFFCVLLTIAGWVLLAAATLAFGLLKSTHVAVNLSIAGLLYLPWQVLFSYGVLVICEGRRISLLRGFLGWWNR